MDIFFDYDVFLFTVFYPHLLLLIHLQIKFILFHEVFYF